MEICSHGLDCNLPNDYSSSIRFRFNTQGYTNSTSVIDHDTYSCTDDGICHVAFVEKSARKMVVEIDYCFNRNPITFGKGQK